MPDHTPAERARTHIRIPRRSLVWILGGAVAIAAVVGSDRVPANPTEALSLQGVPVPRRLSRATLRIGTYNIHGCKGQDDKRDLGRTARSLANLDIIGLQEVHGYPVGEFSSQAGSLGTRLGMASVFVPTERRWWHNHFGNAVLTRVDLTGIHRIPLVGTQSARYRTTVLCTFQHEDQTVNLLLTHADNRNDHDSHLRLIIDLFLALDEPAILMGDLNTRTDDPQLANLIKNPEVDAVVGESWPDGRTPLKGVDWIICRGLRVVSSETRDLGASDHAVVCAELEIIYPDATSATAGRDEQHTTR